MACVSVGGGRMYLFTGQGNAKLIITAHGEKLKGRFTPPGKSLLWFCSMHGKSTRIDVKDIVGSFSSDGRKLDKLKSADFHPHLVGDITEYGLLKFAGEHGGGDRENYDVYEAMTKRGVDILTPRNRWFSKEVTLSYALNLSEVINNSYKNIYCSFCRS